MTPFEKTPPPVFFFRSPHPELFVCHNFSSNLWVTSQISKAKVFLDSLRRGICSDFFKNCLQSRATVWFLTPSAHPQKSVLTTETSQNLLAFIKSLYWVFCVVFFYFLCEKHWQRSLCWFIHLLIEKKPSKPVWVLRAPTVTVNNSTACYPEISKDITGKRSNCQKMIGKTFVSVFHTKK